MHACMMRAPWRRGAARARARYRYMMAARGHDGGHVHAATPAQPTANFWRFFGPGWLVSLAYVDPGNLEADLQMGAYTGTSLLWVLLSATVGGLLLQTLAARLGVVTGRDLAQTCRAQYLRWTSIGLWLTLELAIIGSDVQEIVGTAIAFNILLGLPLWVGALLTALDTATFLGLQQLGVRRLEAFICALIATMALCFAANLVAAAPPVAPLLHGIAVPTMPRYGGLTIAVGAVGALIMPANL
eukprot:SAG22_NODE_264_length_13353_cov_34.575298_4_plen_243_part_00